MKLYRVVTENKNYQSIIVYLMEHKLDATIIQANGLWQGKAEKSLVIEIAGDLTTIEKFVYWLKKHNKQDKVMLQVIEAEIQLM